MLTNGYFSPFFLPSKTRIEDNKQLDGLTRHCVVSTYLILLASLFYNIKINDKEGHSSELRTMMNCFWSHDIKTIYPINIFYVYMWILRCLLVFLRGKEFFRFSRISKYRELHASHRYSSYTFSRLISARCLLTGEFSTMYLCWRARSSP